MARQIRAPRGEIRGGRMPQGPVVMEGLARQLAMAKRCLDVSQRSPEQTVLLWDHVSIKNLISSPSHVLPLLIFPYSDYKLLTHDHSLLQKPAFWSACEPAEASRLQC